MRFNALSLQKSLKYAFFTGILALSYVISRSNYLLFHSLAELFSVIISSCIFIIVWNLKEKAEKPFFVLLGISYLFVGIIDLFHTLSYQGMSLFETDFFFANQLWIGARFLEAISLFIFVYFMDKKYKLNYYLIFALYLALTTTLLLGVFHYKIFPVCFVLGKGQTLFKIISEYLIILILSGSLFLIHKKRSSYEQSILRYLSFSLLTTIISEFLFTLYTDNYGITNVLGHIFKIISFYLIYKSIIVTNIEEPFSVVFSKLSSKLEEISKLNIKLELADRTKNKFFSIISHDLKNPMAGLKGILALVNSDWEKFSETEKKDSVQLLLHTSEKVSNLLDNLLLWSKHQMEKITVHKEITKLNPIVEKNISLLSHNASAKKVSILNQIKGDISLYVDKNMLDTVIRNLLTNALKFSYPEGKVYLSLKEDSKNLHIQIRDNGIGLSKEEQRNLFKINVIHHRRGTSNEEGTGLGLIICKEFIEKNHGKLLVDCEKNKGCSFEMVFKKSLASEKNENL